MGRKVYLAATVVLIAIMRHGASNARVRRMNETIRVDRHTIERWRRWWHGSFTKTPFWQVAGATLMPPVDPDKLPASLIDRFTGDDADRLIGLLRFIQPITGGRARAS